MECEIASISRMGSASLREAAEAMQRPAFPEAERSAVLDAVSTRAISIQTDLKYWDLVAIVQAHAASSSSIDEDRLEVFSEILRGKLSFLSPKHLVDLLASFETMNFRPTKLYHALGHRLTDLVRSSIYVDELVALTRVIARNGIKNPQLIAGITNALRHNDALKSQLRILHCCEITGAFAHIEHLDVRLAKILREKVSRELDLVPLEELWKTVTGFETLCFSYLPFEEQTRARLRSFVDRIEARQFDQVTSPMEFFQFIRLNEWLTESVLIAACKWASDAVYRPATRTEAHRRPNIFEVALLADLCRELDVSSDRVEKAIKITVTSKGGTEQRIAKPKPLRYRRRRAYINELDGYEALQVKPVKALHHRVGEKKGNEAAFAPLLRSKGEELWKSRSGPWFLRK